MIKVKMQNEPTFGYFQQSASPMASATLARTGVDWILIDLQHGEVDWHTLPGVLMALENAGVSSIVRTRCNEPSQIMRILDLGAAGILVPMVSTPAEARCAVDATRYPPQGSRSFGPIRNANGYLGSPLDIDSVNRAVFCFAMIETAEGMSNLEEIAATPGLDGLFVGPADLSISFGAGLDPACDQVRDALTSVAAACRMNQLVAGTVAGGALSIEYLVTLGYRFLALGTELSCIDGSARRTLEEARTVNRKSD